MYLVVEKYSISVIVFDFPQNCGKVSNHIWNIVKKGLDKNNDKR